MEGAVADRVQGGAGPSTPAFRNPVCSPQIPPRAAGISCTALQSIPDSPSAGTSAVRSDQHARVFTPEQVARNVAKLNTPERAAKIAAAKRGKPRPCHLIEAVRRANLGRKHSPETRAK